MDTKNPDILIVGAGPTGLMMACQLLRFGVAFRIIDKNPDRAQESRAFGLQARTMELFQNLGLGEAFLKRCQIGRELQVYTKGKPSFNLNFENIAQEDTPFPGIYFLPQPETEEILLSHLEKNKISIERSTELVSFTKETENTSHYKTCLKNKAGQFETIYCQYIVGCDGAHSIVREILDIPFVGAAYDQDFILADISMEWPFSKTDFSLFLNKRGILGFIPLNVEKNLQRLIIAGMGNNIEKQKNEVRHSGKNTPTLNSIEQYVKAITHQSDIKISNPVWVSEFHLHHRVVEQYQRENAFLAGDAAHIHSPVGAQGMNTGLQDAANLAWKLALVIKYHTSKSLLKTYQTERLPVGQKLVRTTDKIFGFMIQRNLVAIFVKLFVMPFVMKFLSKSNRFKHNIFSFLSELGIYYKLSRYVREDVGVSKSIRDLNLKAGMRAPDAPIKHTTLFELLREKPFNILIFSDSQSEIREDKLIEFQSKYPELIKIHRFMKDSTLEILFSRYSAGKNALYLIRPDGYIGYQSLDNNEVGLCKYLNDLLSEDQ